MPTKKVTIESRPKKVTPVFNYEAWDRLEKDLEMQKQKREELKINLEKEKKRKKRKKQELYKAVEQYLEQVEKSNKKNRKRREQRKKAEEFKKEIKNKTKKEVQKELLKKYFENSENRRLVPKHSDEVQEDVFAYLSPFYDEDKVAQYTRYVTENHMNVQDYINNPFLSYEEWLENEEMNEQDTMEQLEKISRFFEVGAAFIGEEEVEEEINSNYYIPSSPYCVYNCLKYLKNIKPIAVNSSFEKKDFTINSKHLNKYFNIPIYVIHKYKKIDYEIKYDMKNITTKRDKSAKIKDVGKYPYLLLCKIEDNYYHSVLIFNEIKELTLKYAYPDILLDNKEDHLNQYPISAYKPKIKQNKIVVWDVEAIQKDGTGKITEHKAKALGWRSVYLDKNVDQVIESKCKLIWCDNPDNPYKNDLIYEFLTQLCEEFKNSISNIRIYAHNSGGYDTYYLLRCPHIKIIDDIFISGKYKLLKFKFNDRIFEAIDSMSYFPTSLFNFNVSTKNKYFIKQDFEIAIYRSNEEYEENKYEILKYLESDVNSLAESLITFETWLNNINQSITTSLTTPAIAMKHYLNNSIPILYNAKSNNVRLFQRESVYGGRVFHTKKEETDLICLDANSLYPAALTYDYPYGKFKVDCSQDIKFIEKLMKNKLMFIAEVTLDGGNIDVGIVPWKKDRKSTLIYPSNEFTGVYNSVDILSALSAGYKIISYKQCIYWEEKTKVFKDFIESLYETRNKLKKEGNPAEQVYKLLMNSFFGKFLMNINYKSKYYNDEDKVTKISVKLPNGQIRTREKCYSVVKYPVYIGGFVLSYARAIMNKLFLNIKPIDIIYGDTDSIYIRQDKSQNIKQSSELGDFKNDYGEGVIIKYGLFADYKRYYLEFNKCVEEFHDCSKQCVKSQNYNNKCVITQHNCKIDIPKGWEEIWNIERECDCKLFKCKFNGLHLNYKIDETMKKKFINVMNGGTMIEIQDKWSRDIKHGIRINTKELRFITDPSNRYIWKDGRSYPLDFNFSREVREFKYDDWLLETDVTENVNISFYSKDKILFKKIPSNNNMKNDFLIPENSEILRKSNYSLITKKNALVPIICKSPYNADKWYYVNENGMKDEINYDEIEVFKYIIALKNESPLTYKATLNDIKKIINFTKI